ncbi:hypothetical protein MRB53_042057 [Persea americana]|nr:hypothetical protein MRB53_042057 [Persea americana]
MTRQDCLAADVQRLFNTFVRATYPNDRIPDVSMTTRSISTPHLEVEVQEIWGKDSVLPFIMALIVPKLAASLHEHAEKGGGVRIASRQLTLGHSEGPKPIALLLLSLTKVAIHRGELVADIQEDAIKSAARKQAWYHNADPETSRTYNIFGRGGSNPQRRIGDSPISDVGLHRARPLQDFEDPARRSHELGSPSVRRSGTFPERIEIPVKTDSSVHQSPVPAVGLVDAPPLQDWTDELDDDLARTHLYQRAWKKYSRWRPSFWRQFKYQNAKFTASSQFKSIFLAWSNLLLVFVPIGFIARYTNLDSRMIFSMNFLAMLPIATMLAYSVDEAVLYIGKQFGGLLSMSLR